ncbi:hypothetical protein RCL1_008039 [Eukaryota sp. TZLM3-RCL]
MRILNVGLDPESEESRTINSFAEQYGEAYIATYKTPHDHIPLGEGRIPPRPVGTDKAIIRIIHDRMHDSDSSSIACFNSVPVLTRRVSFYSELSFDITKYKAVPSSHPEYELCIEAARIQMYCPHELLVFCVFVLYYSQEHHHFAKQLDSQVFEHFKHESMLITFYSNRFRKPLNFPNRLSTFASLCLRFSPLFPCTV